MTTGPNKMTAGPNKMTTCPNKITTGPDKMTTGAYHDWSYTMTIKCLPVSHLSPVQPLGQTQPACCTHLPPFRQPSLQAAAIRITLIYRFI